MKLHPDEVDTDAALVGRLLADQFPALAGLPVQAFRSTGTVNAIYRLGDELYVRLPRLEQYADDLGAATAAEARRLAEAVQGSVGVVAPLEHQDEIRAALTAPHEPTHGPARTTATAPSSGVAPSRSMTRA